MDAEPLDVDALADAIAERVLGRLASFSAQRFLNVTQAAAYTGVSEDTIRCLLAGGKLTPLRPVPGRIVIDKAELDAHVRASNKTPRRGRGRRAGGSR